MSSNPSTSGSGPCGACKFLRRKCVAGCIFAPYFDSDQGAAHFAAVHKVFGASNVSKLLFHLPVQRRHEAVVTICYEAQARLKDPVYGCVSHIFALQQQVVSLQAELAYFQAQLTTLEGLSTPPPPPPPPTQLSINDLTTVLASYDLSSLLEPMAIPPSWTMQPPRNPRQFMSFEAIGGAPTDLPQPHGGAGDFQEQPVQRPNRGNSEPMTCKTEASSMPPHNR